MAALFALIVRKPPNEEDEICKEIVSTTPSVPNSGDAANSKDGLLLIKICFK